MRSIVARCAAGAIASMCIALLGACGGGAGGAGTPPSTSGVSASTDANTAKVVIKLIVPPKIAAQVVARSSGAVQSATRSAQYVSPSTLSMNVSVTPAAGSTQVSFSFRCSATSCIASFLAPVGNDRFAISLTDARNGGGDALALSDATPVTIAPGVVNSVNLTANPVVSSVAVLLGAVPAATVRTNGGAAADVPVTVEAIDAGGNIIVGPGTYVDAHGTAVTLSLSAANAQAGGQGTVSLSGTTTFTAPSSATTMAHYDGKWLDHTTITATSTSALIAPSTATLATIPTSYEYSSGIGGTKTFDITTGPDGNLWFTQWGGNVYRSTTSGVITQFTNPAFSSTSGITTGPDGALWIADIASGKTYRMTTGGALTTYTNPSHTPTERVASGPDGNLWFTENSANQILRMSPAGAMTEFPCGCTAPVGITSGSDGNIWFSAIGDSSIGKITPSGSVTNYTTANGISPGACPFYVINGPDGNLWFPECNIHSVGRITVNGSVTEFGGIVGTARDGGTVGPDGNIWVDDYGNGALARVTLSGAITEYSNGITGGSRPLALTVGPVGNIWFTEFGAPRIGKFVW